MELGKVSYFFLWFFATVGALSFPMVAVWLVWSRIVAGFVRTFPLVVEFLSVVLSFISRMIPYSVFQPQYIFIMLCLLLMVYVIAKICVREVKKTGIWRLLDAAGRYVPSVPAPAAALAHGTRNFLSSNLYRIVGGTIWMAAVAYVANRVRIAYAKYRRTAAGRMENSSRGIMSVFDLLLVGFAGVGTLVGAKTVFSDLRNLTFVKDCLTRLFGDRPRDEEDPRSLDLAYRKFLRGKQDKTWFSWTVPAYYVEEIDDILRAIKLENLPVFARGDIQDVQVLGVRYRNDPTAVGWARSSVSSTVFAAKIVSILNSVDIRDQAQFEERASSLINQVKSSVFGIRVEEDAALPDVHSTVGLHENIYLWVSRNATYIKYAGIFTVFLIFAVEVIKKSGVLDFDPSMEDPEPVFAKPVRRFRRNEDTADIPGIARKYGMHDVDNPLSDDFYKYKLRRAAALAGAGVDRDYKAYVDDLNDIGGPLRGVTLAHQPVDYRPGKWAQMSEIDDSADVSVGLGRKALIAMNSAFNSLVADLKGTWAHLTFEDSGFDCLASSELDLDLDVMPSIGKSEADIKDACFIPRPSDNVYKITANGGVGTCFVSTFGGHKLILTAAHCTDKDGLASVHAKGSVFPCQTVWKSSDLCALLPVGNSKEASIWLNGLFSWKLSKTAPKFGDWLGVDSLDGIATGSCMSKGAVIGNTSQYFYGCTTVPGHSGCPVYVATKANALSVVGIHTNAGARDVSNIFTSLVEHHDSITLAVQSFRATKKSPSPPVSGGAEVASSSSTPQ